MNLFTVSLSNVDVKEWGYEKQYECNQNNSISRVERNLIGSSDLINILYTVFKTLVLLSDILGLTYW